ncbi:MAG: dCTP deaminase [Nitrospirae bacterium]|nr:MAG: dCTP deaminase [Nitrospirota bacterium]
MQKNKLSSGRLNDNEIMQRLMHNVWDKKIIITPLISLKDQLGSNSLDLRLGTEFIVTERPNYTHIDPLDAKIEEQEIKFRLIKRLSPLKPFILHPREFALGSTLEYIKIPNDLVGHLEGRSTWARMGTLVHLTAGLIHPGSAGTITFELLNAGDVPIKLYPGIRIAQLVFYTLNEPLKSYEIKFGAKYSGNLRVSKPIYWNDMEIDILRDSRDKGKTNLENLKLKEMEIENRRLRFKSSGSGL